MADHVADLYDVCPHQVRAWLKKSDEIRKEAKSRFKGKNCRRRKKKGRFGEAEDALMVLFRKERDAGRRVGPRWIRRTMLSQVALLDPQPPTVHLFRARRGWLRRFAKRQGICLRRKTNVKKIPIALRVPLLKRWFAVFRIFLRKGRNNDGYTERYGRYRTRYSLDQVPAGNFDPKSTYEFKGKERVVIAANEAFDKYRWMTLQILIRNRKNPTLPRNGQPKLCICFRGTGTRIGRDERDQYHSDVYVLFQPKAWFDSATCNKWVVEVAAKEIDRDAGRSLILADNLSGQTRKTNPQFMKLLDEMCGADMWNLLAGNTDEIQVVDAGFGKLVKDETEEILTDWLKVEANWEEWMNGRMTASRKRVLCTHWYAAGYERACESYEFPTNFDRCGSNLSPTGVDDDKVALQGLGEFSFCDADAQRDPKTGAMPLAIEAPIVTEGNVEVVADAVADDSEDDENDQEELSETGDVDPDGEGPPQSSSGSSNDELDGPDFDAEAAGGQAVKALPADYPECILGKTIHHRYDDGWYPGKVLRQIQSSTMRGRNGKFAMKFEDSVNEIDHELSPDDYGPERHWVLIVQP